MKKNITLFLGLLLCLSLNSFAQITFTDTNFKNALLSNPAINTNGDGAISFAEAAAVTNLTITNKSISDLDGLEHFINIEVLDCSNNNIEEIDTSPLTKLKFLIAENNSIKTIDVRTNTLWTLRLSGNPLVHAYLTGPSTFQIESIFGVSFSKDKIEYVCISAAQYGVQDNGVDHKYFWDSLGSALHIGDCTIQAPPTCPIINFADINFKNAILKNFPSYDLDGDGEICIDEAEKVKNLYGLTNENINDIGGIEYFKNLETIGVSNNNITSLDFSQNPKLIDVQASNNNINNVNFTQNVILENFYLSSNQLSEIDLSNNTKLISVSINSNQLSQLDVSNKPNLITVLAINNQITSFNTDNCSSLNWVQIWDNQITSVNLGTNTSLERFQISNNKLSEIDIRNCKIKTLDVSDNPSLKKAFLTGDHTIYNSFSDFLPPTSGSTSGVNISNCPNLSFICVNNVSFFNDIKNYITGIYPGCTVTTDCSLSTSTPSFDSLFVLGPIPTNGTMYLTRRDASTIVQSADIYNASTGALAKRIALTFEDGFSVNPTRGSSPGGTTRPLGDPNSALIDCTDLLPGTYILKVYSTNGTGTFSKTFVKI
ncbi:conserved exported protein of unknown function [Tenacibaculum sp. 190130A14a]|uniref:Secreted protein (Por secretion system target) n=1 Tax=Tenacibaculum polynesiense TaxID=3137857 RepID=A0ABM9P793_9FLAO